MSDYYKTLGLDKGASDGEIKRAYRKLAMQYHPDRNDGNKADEEKFKKISEAYAVLSDPKKKSQYDQFGDQAFHQQYSTEDIFKNADFSSIFSDLGMGSRGFENIFSQMFGGSFGGGGFQRAPVKGQDVELSLNISFEDAFRGVKHPVRFKLSNGDLRDLKVKIPAGVISGSKLRLAGKGATSSMGGPSGDVYIKVSVNSHHRYNLKDSNIYVNVPLKVTEALLGSTQEVETMDGVKKVKIPAGVGPQTKIRLRGLGFPKVGASNRGDFYITVDMKVPKKLTENQRALINELKDEGL